jgi:hypothetical protein
MNKNTTESYLSQLDSFIRIGKAPFIWKTLEARKAIGILAARAGCDQAEVNELQGEFNTRKLNENIAGLVDELHDRQVATTAAAPKAPPASVTVPTATSAAVLEKPKQAAINPNLRGKYRVAAAIRATMNLK